MSADFARIVDERRLAEAVTWWRQNRPAWRDWMGHLAADHFDVLAAAAAERIRDGEADR
jgi:hypothetical protein